MPGAAPRRGLTGGSGRKGGDAIDGWTWGVRSDTRDGRVQAPAGVIGS